MAKIVRAERLEAGAPNRGCPESTPPEFEADVATLWCREDEVVGFGTGCHELIAQRRCGNLRDRHRPVAGSGLGRTEVEVATHVCDDLGDVDLLPQWIDSPGPEPEQLSDTEAGEGGDDDRGAEAPVHGVGEASDLLGSEEPHLASLDPREPNVGRRVGCDQPGANGVGEDLVQEDELTDVDGKYIPGLLGIRTYSARWRAGDPFDGVTIEPVTA